MFGIVLDGGLVLDVEVFAAGLFQVFFVSYVYLCDASFFLGAMPGI